MITAVDTDTLLTALPAAERLPTLCTLQVPTSDSGSFVDPPQCLPGSGQVRRLHGGHQGNRQTPVPERRGQC